MLHISFISVSSFFLSQARRTTQILTILLEQTHTYTHRAHLSLANICQINKEDNTNLRLPLLLENRRQTRMVPAGGSGGGGGFLPIQVVRCQKVWPFRSHVPCDQGVTCGLVLQPRGLRPGLSSGANLLKYSADYQARSLGSAVIHKVLSFFLSWRWQFIIMVDIAQTLWRANVVAGGGGGGASWAESYHTLCVCAWAGD